MSHLSRNATRWSIEDSQCGNYRRCALDLFNLLLVLNITATIAFFPDGKSEIAMRALLAFVLALGVGGCTDRERAHLGTFLDAPFGEDADAAPPPPIPAQLDPKCREVASERSTDVAAEGFDGDVARKVFDSVYADCVAWEQRRSDVQ